MASLLNLPLWIGMSVAAAASAVAAPVPQAAPHHKLAVIRLTDATTVDAARLCGVALDCQARLPDDQAEIVVTADQEQRMLLLGARMAPEFRKGAVCRIDLDGAPAARAGRLIWHATPKMLRSLGK